MSGFRAGSEPLHFATLWEAIADEIPAAPALTHGTRTIGWGEFELRAARLAGALRAHGLGPGSVVACYLYNCPEYFETFLAALKIRAVPANVNYRYGGAELRALLENCEAEALFFDSALRERVASVRHDLPWIRLLVEVGEAAPAAALPGACGYEKLISSSDPAPRVSRSEQDVFLSYTGGTTGLPKGVRYTIGRGVANSLRLREEFLGTGTELGIVDYAAEQARNGDRLVAIPASPLMHSTGFTFASLPTLTSGGQVATLEGRSFDAASSSPRSVRSGLRSSRSSATRSRCRCCAPWTPVRRTAGTTPHRCGPSAQRAPRGAPASSSACSSTCRKPPCSTFAGPPKGSPTASGGCGGATRPSPPTSKRHAACG